MSDHITPEQAEDFLGGYEEREDGAYYLPESIGKAALSMIAGARYEYAVALRTEDGVEYRAPYRTWVKDSQAALWTPNRWSLHPDYWGAGEYIVTRLVIDLGEVEA